VEYQAEPEATSQPELCGFRQAQAITLPKHLLVQGVMQIEVYLAVG
jgi:hypothetical protein